jgi:hypothetical protein
MNEPWHQGFQWRNDNNYMMVLIDAPQTTNSSDFRPPPPPPGGYLGPTNWTKRENAPNAGPAPRKATKVTNSQGVCIDTKSPVRYPNIISTIKYCIKDKRFTYSIKN